MNIFKSLYETKKLEIETKQGKNGTFMQYLLILPVFGIYWFKAFFVEDKEILFIFLIPATIFVIVTLNIKSNHSIKKRPAQNRSFNL